MSMPYTVLASRDGSERPRYRRVIQRIGAGRAAKLLGLNRATVLAYAAGAAVQLANETVLVLGLPDLEREAERR
jgi:hypothetical protein